ncbi:hypothetical protein ABXN37_19485 [Piscinibacter sakaiensis]|uniref:Uncharacterized protein n=1 Tax=Piscinibacter sakaiensis TaxID=1547922 RepID=A0A0K8P3Z7_PISS1|nr:hypothetical protein [Piscinibacter sakaiensis]GAP37311.1 hypothetical protein ISF6_3166 [Piscinibacter sakaiensis]
MPNHDHRHHHPQPTAEAPATDRYRLVVRGTLGDMRVRRVRTISAADYLEAWAMFDHHAEAMSEGLAEVVHQVLPSVGWRLDGQPSKGYEVADASA